MIINIIVIIFASIFIYFFSERLAHISTRVGDYFHLPRSVKGATLDAIASSFPELMVAIFAIISFNKFEVGVGTIAGSALFNLLVIPAFSVLLAPVVFKVSREVMYRDAMFYNISVFALLAGLMYAKMWGFMIPIIFILIYIWYIRDAIAHSKNHRITTQKEVYTETMNIWKEIIEGLFYLAIVAGSAFFLTEHAISLAEVLNVPAIIIAFTVIAAATSLPDAVVSITNAKKGNIDDAVSNVFGSNIFDILIGLSVPVLLAVFLFGQKVEVYIEHIELILGLLGATVLSIYFIAEDYTLNKKKAFVLLLMYIAFMVYVIHLGFA